MATLDLSALDTAVAAYTAIDGAPARAPLTQFEEDPANPRTEFDGPEFDQLVEDVKVRGILQPIVVRRVDSGRLRIRFGARRYRAAAAAGLVDAPYVVTEDERQFDDYAQVAENERRSPLQPMELATFIARKVAQRERKQDIADKLRITPTALTFLLALVDAPPFLLEIYQAHRCRAPHLLYYLRKLHTQKPDLVVQRCVAASDIDARFVAELTAEIKGTERKDKSVASSAPTAVAGADSGDGEPGGPGGGADSALGAGSTTGLDAEGGGPDVAGPSAPRPDSKPRPGPTAAQIREALRELADAYETIAVGGAPAESKAAAKRRLTYVRALLAGINPD